MNAPWLALGLAAALAPVLARAPATALFPATVRGIGLQTPIADPAPRPAENPPPVPVGGTEDPPRRAPADAPAIIEPGAQDPNAPATEPRIAVPEAAAPAPMAWDGRAPSTPEELDQLLATLASAYPDRLRVQSLGRSRAGRSVWLASVTSAAAEDALRVPALVELPPAHLPGHDGLEPLLQACVGLLEKSTQDPHLAARLSTAAVHFLLTPDPERTFSIEGVAGPAADFPAGWTGSDGGTHPLHEPATRAVAEFLLRQPSIGLVVRAEPAASTPFALVGEAALAGGSLERFAREYLGLAVAVVPPATGSPAERRTASSERARILLAALPRLDLANTRVERARPDLWIVELDLVNRGSVGSLEGPALARERASVWAELTEGTLVAATRASAAPLHGSPAGVFEPVAARANTFDLGHLPGGATVHLRLVVRGTEGTRASLVVGSLRAGSAALALELR